jgi:lysophospholipase L1-like esterase
MAGGAPAGGAPASGGSTATGGSGTSGSSGSSGGGFGGVDSSGGLGGSGGMEALGGAGLSGGSGGASGIGGSAAGGGQSAGATSGGNAGVGGAGAGGAGAGGADGDIPACASNQMAMCAGNSPITCHFGGMPGDYRVTVDLGGSTPGDMYVESEAYRRVLGKVTTGAGETRRFSFLVNVREPEGQPVQSVPAGTNGLDLYVRGTAPRLSAVCYERQKPAPKVWIAGDSTVCDQSDTNYSGWGQHLPQFFGAPISIANYADSGESSGSFLGNGRLWGAIKAGWVAGDWVFIQFGHNDKTVTAAAFRSNLTAMVTEAKSAGVRPILVTPISRAETALASQHVNSTGANLPRIVREVGTAESVPVIDLTVTTSSWLDTIDWKDYFALGTDRTHTNPAGAEVVAGFVRDAISEQQIGLQSYLR